MSRGEEGRGEERRRGEMRRERRGELEEKKRGVTPTSGREDE